MKKARKTNQSSQIQILYPIAGMMAMAMAMAPALALVLVLMVPALVMTVLMLRERVQKMKLRRIHSQHPLSLPSEFIPVA